MKNKNILSRIKKLVYVFGCLILLSYFAVAPHQTEASFLGDVWNGITNAITGSESSSSSSSALLSNSLSISDQTRVKQLSDEIFKANADPLRKQLLLNLVIEREALIKELMRKDPALFLSLAIKASQRNLLPLNIQPYIEKETTLTSKIEVIHIDDFDNPQNSRFDYFLKDIDGKTKINFFPTDPLYLVSNSVIKASGFKLGDNFVSQTNRTNFSVQETPALESTGDQKTLVILLEFNDSPSTRPFTKEKAYDLVFNDQFQDFYKEQSYNQVSFSGEVVDWYKLNRSSSHEYGCSAATNNELGQIIKDRGINLSQYKRVVFLPSTTDSGGWSYVGAFNWNANGISYNFSKACVGIKSFNNNSAWGPHPFEWKNFDFVMSHEMGHSLGVTHASGWDCGNKSLGDNCTKIEYGNRFDSMGYGQRSLHFNAIYKEILGWIKPSQILEINNSGTYSINTLEKDSAIKFAKVSNYTQTDTPYYLEYRKAFGFDSKLKEENISSNQNGLFINKKSKDGDGLKRSLLIDASPTTDSWGNDILKATLNSNTTFADPDNGISIDNVSNSTENSIDFRVTYNKPDYVYLTLDKTSDRNSIVKLYAWRDGFNDYGETVDSDFTDGEIKTLINGGHYKLVAIPDSNSLGFSGWTGCDSQTQGKSWTDADGVVHYSKPFSGEKACFVELSDESKQIEVDFTEPSEISASPNPVSSGKSATLTWAASSGPGDCYLYSPTDNLKTIKSTAFYMDTNSASRFYKGPGYYAIVARNASGVTANLTAPTDYTLTCDIETLNNAVSYNLKVGIASSGASSSSSSISYGDSGVDTVFNYTGGVQQYLVPSGVTNVNIKASGAQGNGLGGESSAIVAVTPGETLYIYAGGQPSGRTGGWNGGGNGGTTSWGGSGGGGGGASDVRKGGTALANRIIVAGGGGGRGSNDVGGFRMGGAGGIAGGLAGSSGGSGQNDAPVSGGGGGGTQTYAGSAGIAGGGNGGASGNAGAVGNGGAGGVGPSGASGGGGGGGGYFGGGGGGVNYQSAGGGGGGSSYVTGARTSMKSGVRSGDGQVIITPFLPSSSSSSSSAKSSSSSSSSSSAQPSITVLSPNGGEVCKIGSVCKISWTYNAINPTNAYLAINLLKGDKEVYTPLLSNDNKGFYDWLIPNTNVINGGNDYKIRVMVYDYTNGQKQALDYSDNYFSIVASSSLLAYYAFDGEGENGAITYDYSVNGNNGIIIGATRTTTGTYGGGLYFDGIDDYVNLGNPTSLQPGKISLSAWFKTSSSGMIMRKRLYGYGLEMLSSGKVSFWIYNSAAAKFSAISPNVYNDGQWHHALGIYDGSAVKLYIDGSQTASATAGKVYYGTGGIAIGRDGNASVSYFKGYIDQVRLYNYPLSFSEIDKLYEEGTNSSSKPSSSSSSSSSSASAKGSLSIIVRSQPESQNVPAGFAQFTFANYVFDAISSGEDVKFTTVPLEYNIGGGAAANINNCKLYAGSTVLNTGSNIVNPLAAGSSTSFTLDNALTITKGTSKTLTLKCDVSPSADVGDYYSWGYDISSDPVIIGKTSSSNIDETEYDNPGQKMTVIHDCEHSGFCSSSSTSSSSSSAAAGLANGLIAQYRFDGGSANDSYGNNDGSIFGAVSSSGIAGGALSFDGNDYVQIAGLLGKPANITISAWANLTSADTKGAELISLGDYVGLRLDQIEATPFGLAGFYHYSSGWRPTRLGTNYAGAGWHHFAYVVDDAANSQKLYVDGALASTTSYAESIAYTGAGANTFIGKHGNGGTTKDFYGKIDEVKIYNRALTAEEVSKLYSLPGINCDITDGTCAFGYKTNWLNQFAATLEAVGQTIKQLFIIKK